MSDCDNRDHIFNSSTNTMLPVASISNSINQNRNLVGQVARSRPTFHYHPQRGLYREAAEPILTTYEITLNFLIFYIHSILDFGTNIKNSIRTGMINTYKKTKKISLVTIVIISTGFIIYRKLIRDFKHPTFWQMIKSTLRGQSSFHIWWSYIKFQWNNLITIGSTKYSKTTVEFKNACMEKFKFNKVKSLSNLLERDVKLKKNHHPEEANLRDKFKLSFKPQIIESTTLPVLTLDKKKKPKTIEYLAVSGRSNSEGPRSLYGFEHGDYQYSLKASVKDIKIAKALVFTNSMQHCSDDDLGHWFSLGKDIFAFVPHITQPFIKGNVLYKYIEEDNKLYTETTIDGGSTYVEPYYIYTKYDYVSIIHKEMEYVYKVNYIKPHPNVLILHYQPIAKIIPGFLPTQPIREYVKLMTHNIIRYHDSLTWIAKVGKLLVTSKHEVKDYDIIQRMTNGSANSTANVFSREEIQGETKFKHEEYLKKFNLTSTVKNENESLNVIADSVSGTELFDKTPSPTDINDITLPKPIPKDENAIVLENIKQTKTVSMNSRPDVEDKTTKHTDLGANKAFLPEKSFKSRLFAVRLRYLSRSNCPEMSDAKMNQILNHMDEFVDLIYKHTGPVTKLQYDQLSNKYKENVNTTYHEICNKMKWNKVDIFVKGEGYSSCKGSRTISNVDTHQVMEGLLLSAPIHSIMSEKIHWYGPGKTKINYVDTLCCAPIDYSGWDGSICFILKLLIHKILLKYYPEEKELIDEIVGSELFSVFKVKTRRSNMIKKINMILVLAAVLSGGSMTASGNTWIAGFLQYHSYRHFKKSIEEAWRIIGIVYGDDGNVNRIMFDKVCKYLGITFGVKATPEDKYIPGIVPFLGKIFYDDKGQLSADRILYKFSVSFSHYSDLVNILMKWAGFYNPKIDVEKQLPIFSMIGKLAYHTLASKPKHKELLDSYLLKLAQYKGSQFLDTGKEKQSQREDLFIYRMGKSNYAKFKAEIYKYVSTLKSLTIDNAKEIVNIVNKHCWEFFPTPTSIKGNVTLYLNDVIYQANEYDGDYDPKPLINYIKMTPRFKIFKDYFKGKSVQSVRCNWKRIVVNTYDQLIELSDSKKLKDKYKKNQLEFISEFDKLFKSKKKSNHSGKVVHPNGHRQSKSLKYQIKPNNNKSNKKNFTRNGKIKEKQKQKFSKIKQKPKTKTKKYVKTNTT